MARGEPVELLTQAEMERIEREHAAGVPARVIVEVFAAKGVRLSEATFRKYVQAGLVPRSRRVGRKGKHRGSQGLYPVEAVRRINTIKMMMATGLTIEDIKDSFVVLKNHIELADRELLQVFAGFEHHIEDKPWAERYRRELATRLRALRAQARELIHEVARLGSAVTAREGVTEH